MKVLVACEESQTVCKAGGGGHYHNGWGNPLH